MNEIISFIFLTSDIKIYSASIYLKILILHHRIFLHFSGRSVQITVSLSFYPFTKRFCTLVAKGCNNVGIQLNFIIEKEEI